MFKPFPCREITCLLPILLIISGIGSLWMFMLTIMIKRILLLLLYCYVYCSNYHHHQHHHFILPSCSRFLSIPLFTFTFHYSSTHVEIFLLILFKRLKMWITKRIFMQSENVKCTHNLRNTIHSRQRTYVPDLQNKNCPSTSSKLFLSSIYHNQSHRVFFDETRKFEYLYTMHFNSI